MSINILIKFKWKKLKCKNNQEIVQKEDEHLANKILEDITKLQKLYLFSTKEQTNQRKKTNEE